MCLEHCRITQFRMLHEYHSSSTCKYKTFVRTPTDRYRYKAPKNVYYIPNPKSDSDASKKRTRFVTVNLSAFRDDRITTSSRVTSFCVPSTAARGTGRIPCPRCSWWDCWRPGRRGSSTGQSASAKRRLVRYAVETNWSPIYNLSVYLNNWRPTKLSQTESKNNPNS